MVKSPLKSAAIAFPAMVPFVTATEPGALSPSESTKLSIVPEMLLAAKSASRLTAAKASAF
jgi:hypothetical protein